MPDDSYSKPLPTPSPETQRFWDGCKKHELWIPYCRACESFYWYPRDFCPKCFSWDVEWRKASGRGKIHTFAIQYRAWHRGWANDVPYVNAMVDLEEGPRIYTNIVGVEPDPNNIRCDMPVEVIFDDVTDEITLPKFKPA